MKTNNRKYLPIYHEWMSKGQMLRVPDSNIFKTSGLCDAFDDDYLFELIQPTDEDIKGLKLNGLSTFCWASDSSEHCFYEFTPLRQTIVLFLAALNNEL